MTPEEAGQRILEGVEWVVCPHCQGSGDEPGQSESRELGVFYTNAPCTVCFGHRTDVDPDYKRACECLGKPIPEHSIQFTAYGVIGVTVINPNAIKRLSLSSAGPKGTEE